MSKRIMRIRKDQVESQRQFERTLRKLVAVCKHYEAARERVCRKALEDVVDAYGQSPEASKAALRGYMEVVSLVTSSGPPPRFITEMCNSAYPTPQS